MTADQLLQSWRHDSAYHAIVRFIETVTSGPHPVPVAERIAVFDNDGTLWPEKPMPVQMHYIVDQWKAAATRDPSLAEAEPYRSAIADNFAWMVGALEHHAAGDDTELRTVIAAITQATAGMSVTDYEASVTAFADQAEHPTLHRPYTSTAYQPMMELLRYLEANGFTCYVVSGGDRDFMRPLITRCYGIPPERVIGSAFGMNYDPATANVQYGSSFAFLDDGPEKPVRIWSRVGRRPIFAAGNSDGDAEMLDYTLNGGSSDRPRLAILIHHDDADRDAAYDHGAITMLSRAHEHGYTIVSVTNDWATLFPTQQDREEH